MTWRDIVHVISSDVKKTVERIPSFLLPGQKMIITRLKLPLEEVEYSALIKVANDELRSPIDQARFILRQEFERRGLLVSSQDLESVGKDPQGGKNVPG